MNDGGELVSAQRIKYEKLAASISVGKASQQEACDAIMQLCRDNERLAVISGKARAETAAAVAAALEAVKAEARKVKPLEWGQEGKQPEHAVSIIGTYLLMKDFDGWRWMRVVGGNLADVCEAPFATLEAAKAAAQADYEARILAALDKP